jgi:hypothetical protein
MVAAKALPSGMMMVAVGGKVCASSDRAVEDRRNKRRTN